MGIVLDNVDVSDSMTSLVRQCQVGLIGNVDLYQSAPGGSIGNREELTRKKTGNEQQGSSCVHQAIRGVPCEDRPLFPTLRYWTPFGHVFPRFVVR